MNYNIEMQPQLFTLPNGLRVILIDTKAFPTMTTILLFGAGSRYESEKNNGIAHFLEHMIFKGSKKYPDFFTISSILEGMGATHNAFTSKDHTGYWVKAPTEDFETVIEVMADLIKNPLLPEIEIEREKNVIVQEINMYEDQPMRRVSEYFENLLYQGNPLGMDIAGSKETVTSFHKSTFVDYMQQFYHPKNAVLVIAGGLKQVKNSKFKVQSYQKIIEEKFTDFGTGKSTFSTGRILQVSENQSKPQLLVHHKKTEQTHFTIGFRTFSFNDKRRHALTVLGTILGGGSSSRLFIEVREKKGLCYYIHTGRESYHDVGYLASQAGVTNDLETVKNAVKTILVEHEKIKQGKVSAAELTRAKEMIKGRVLLSMEDSSHVASWYGTKEILEGKIESVEEVIEKIEKVQLAEVISLAKQIFVPERLNFALIGPFKEKDFQGLLD